jgi:ABC-type nitrate/sulfonate/bicarbonate transport system permease component
MYAGMLTLAILGYALNQFFNVLYRLLMPWHVGLMRMKDAA